MRIKHMRKLAIFLMYSSPVNFIVLFSLLWGFYALGPRPDEVGQRGLKLLHLWHHSQKIQNPKPKDFCHCRLEDLSGLQGLNNSLVHWELESCLHKACANSLIFTQTVRINLAEKVLIIWKVVVVQQVKVKMWLIWILKVNQLGAEISQKFEVCECAFSCLMRN